MRRQLLVLMIIPFLAIYALSEETKTDTTFILTLRGNYLRSNDAYYRQIYGKNKYYPEIELGVHVYKFLYLRLSYGYLSAEGYTPLLGMRAKSVQHFTSLGPGIQGKIYGICYYKFGFGLFLVSYEEEAMGEKVADSSVGYSIDGGLIFKLFRPIFIETSIRFLTASENLEEVSIDLGGFRAGIGLGVMF